MEYLDSSDSSTSDEEVLNIVRRIERPRNFRVREDQFTKYDNEEFRNRFRLTKENVHLIMELIGNRLQVLSLRRNVLSVMEQILLSLRFYATGLYFIHVVITSDH